MYEYNELHLAKRSQRGTCNFHCMRHEALIGGNSTDTRTGDKPMNVCDKTRKQLLEDIRVLHSQNAKLECNSREMPRSGDEPLEHFKFSCPAYAYCGFGWWHQSY
jgi:hypothetical protein